MKQTNIDNQRPPYLETLIIYGCGGHGRSIADVALNIGINQIMFVDAQAKKNEKMLGYDVNQSFPAKDVYSYIIAIGDNMKRHELAVKLNKSHHNLINIVSNNAYLSKHATLGLGIFIGNYAHIGPNADIGNGTIINTHSIIEHDCIIGEYCHISINAAIAGKTKIDNFVTIGASATIIDGISICSHVVIGAGAVVTNNITEPGTYIGVPAKKINLRCN